MRQIKTLAIVLRRTDFGEADRIVNFLTPQGKIAGLARGARKQKSKLAGGIEIFSINEVVFAQGKSDLKTIVSARMREYFSEIVKDFERTEFAYSAIKQISRASENFESEEFFEILRTVFSSLNRPEIPLDLTKIWFEFRILAAVGDEINLEIDARGDALRPDLRYDFDAFDKVFLPAENGDFGADHIKFLRLVMCSEPRVLVKIVNLGEILEKIWKIHRAMN